MKRRDFITLLGGAAATWPLSARAQDKKVWRVGIIAGGMRSPPYDGFLQGMHDLGYVAGKDYVVEWRIADGRYVRFPEFARELVQLKVDVIFLGTPAAVNPVRDVTRTIPIVMGYSTDPVGNGFVNSLAHPGGNITGLASSSDDTSPKQLELLAAFVPGLRRVALLQNSDNQNFDGSVFKVSEAAARSAGIELLPIDARNSAELERGFAQMAEKKAQAVKVTGDAFFFTQQERIAELALANRLPSIFPQREYAVSGGLMSYGESLKEFFRRAASFVDKIFKGARPGDLPIEQPTRFNLVINRKTADALGLTIPPQLHIFADEVIE